MLNEGEMRVYVVPEWMEGLLVLAHSLARSLDVAKVSAGRPAHCLDFPDHFSGTVRGARSEGAPIKYVHNVSDSLPPSPCISWPLIYTVKFLQPLLPPRLFYEPLPHQMRTYFMDAPK